jgi:hypothetical protein
LKGHNHQFQEKRLENDQHTGKGKKMPGKEKLERKEVEIICFLKYNIFLTKRREAMYCPKCKCEYVEGIYECVDCHVKLVYELPEEPEEKDEEMTFIEDKDMDMVYVGMYRDLGSAEIAKDFLEENRIEARPIVYRFDQITRLYVRKEDAQKAEELLKAFDGTAVEDSKEETPHEMETADEESGKTRSWHFLGKFRQYYRKAWLFIGISSLFWGIYLITIEKSFFQGSVQTALGIFIILIARSRSSHSNKRNR